jgi:hypothetical protein
MVGYFDPMASRSPAQESSDEGHPNVDGGNRFAAVLRRICGRQLMDMAILMVVAVIFSALSQPKSFMTDPDIWWHLSNARILCIDHNVIWTDPYSFTAAGQRWLNWEWLAELPFWCSYRALGLKGVYFISFLALYLNVLLVYWRGWWMSREAGSAFWASAIGFFLMTVNAGPRTIAFAYIAMSAEMLILEASDRGKKRYLWLLPAIFCIWVNLHGTWLIGLVLFVSYILCGSLSVRKGVFLQEGWTRKERNQLWAVFAISLFSLLMNPYSWRLLWNPLDMMLNQKLSVSKIAEWQPLNLSSRIGAVVAIAILAMLLMNCLRGRTWKVYELAFVFLAWYSAFAHVRFSYFAAILTTPMLARDFKRNFNPSSTTIPVMNALVAISAIFVTALYMPSNSTLEDGVKAGFPLQTIASIQPEWRTFNEEHLGGMMDFNRKPIFVDTRWDSFERLGVMRDYIDIVEHRDSIRLLEKYRIDHALLNKNEPLVSILEQTLGWRVVRTEGAGNDRYELFAKSSIPRK